MLQQQGVAVKWATGLLLGTMVLLIEGCWWKTVRPPPRDMLSDTWRGRITSLARTLPFETRAGDADTASFQRGNEVAHVAFSPFALADRIPAAELHRGWIIGRTEADRPVSGLGIPSGTAWVWVDSTSEGWRAIHIPLVPTDSLRVRTLRLGSRPFRSSDRTKVQVGGGSTVGARIVNWRCGPRCCVEGGGSMTNLALDSLLTELHHRNYPP